MSEDRSGSRHLLLTFRLDSDQRQRLKTRLAADGKTMSEVITHGLLQYVQRPRQPEPQQTPQPVPPPTSPVPESQTPQSPPEPQIAQSAPEPQTPPAPKPQAPQPPPEPQTPPAPKPQAPQPVAGSTAPRAAPPPEQRAARPVLPEQTAIRLRELRASGRSGVLSATLAALHEAGWPLTALAEALGVSRQAIQVRVRQRIPVELRDRGTDCSPPPPFPRRRQAHKGRLRPHVTIKIDQALRAAAHRAAAHEGSSLSQVVESILDRYLRHGQDP
jgi:antitoxin component of RelBE/YafQ-DinJ toxin-antitoxin module